MFAPFEVLQEGMGLPFEHALLIILVLGGFIFAAKSFQLALIYWTVSSTGLFLLVYFWAQSGELVNWVPSLTFLIMSVALMSLSLLFVKKAEVGVV